MMTYFDLPVTLLLLVGALLNGLHPAILQAFPLLTGSLLGNRWPARRALRGFLLYTVLLFLWWLLAGIIASALFAADSIWSFGLLIVIALAASIAGLLEVAAVLWPQKPFMRLSLAGTRRLVKNIQKIHTPARLLPVGARLICWQMTITSILYLSIIAVLNAPYPRFSLMVITGYALLYILPLLVMMGMALRHYRLSTLQQWITGHAKYIRLFTAVLLIATSWLLLLQTNMVLNFG